ncbi:MAG TPA: amidohydrolase family protein [Stellaceae bacterium]|jgi:predicted TIM-barrel fold metal-dependent hydrolase|nr:amidohydrolase family protein [Stellaceae bacterium]
MPQDATVTAGTPIALTDQALSRRTLLAASAGLIGTAAMASGGARAQAPAAAPVRPASQWPVRADWLAKRTEEILEPGLPIVDPHHHLWERPGYRYLFPDLLADVGSGHNIHATMFEQAGSMYRADGPEELKSLGETEFVCGVAAMSASGKYGPTRCVAGVVGYVDLRLGSRAKGLLERHIAVSDGRIRGIRNGSTWSDDPTLKVFGGAAPQGLLLDKSFREGFAALTALGLTFDAWLFQTQLSEVVDLARAFPQAAIVLNHVGGPVAIGPYAGKRDEAFAVWRARIQEIASFPNTYVKLGGLGMKMIGFDFVEKPEPPSSQDLAKAWRPYIETCIAAFGPQRAMFESNFPVDKGSCSYQVLWNAFKRIAGGYSADEKTALFSGAAKKAYGLDV